MNKLEVLRKLEGKKFKIDFNRTEATAYLIAKDLKLRIKSNHSLAIDSWEGFKCEILDEIINEEFDCVSVIEYWIDVYNMILKRSQFPAFCGYVFNLTNKKRLVIGTNIWELLEVKELE